MRGYGEKLAVIVSALLFGLFHANLSQLFYAFLLGLLLGYVYLRTGKLRYSIALHMLFNLLGSIVGPALLGSGVTPLAVYLVIFFATAAVGLVLLCLNSRKIYFQTADSELSRGTRFKTAFINAGMLLFALVVIASIVYVYI